MEFKIIEIEPCLNIIINTTFTTFNYQNDKKIKIKIFLQTLDSLCFITDMTNMDNKNM